MSRWLASLWNRWCGNYGLFVLDGPVTMTGCVVVEAPGAARPFRIEATPAEMSRIKNCRFEQVPMCWPCRLVARLLERLR